MVYLLNPKDCYFINHTIPFNCDVKTIEDKDKVLIECGGNIGNTYIMYSLQKILFGKVLTSDDCSGISNLFCAELSKIDTETINNKYKYIIINMQDQLRQNISYYDKTNERFINVNNFLKKINLPILCFGLGSNCFTKTKYTKILNELHCSQKEFIKIISDKSKFFSIRGKYTKIIMDELKITNYKMVGCPTFYLNSKNITRKTPRDLKKIVFAGVQSLISSKKFNSIKFPENAQYYYFCQDYQEYNILMKSNIRNVKIVFLHKSDELDLFFKDKDLTFGNRVHASIISLNNDCLAICTNSDSRALEMCELFNIPHINNLKAGNLESLLNSIDISKINNTYDILKKEHDNFLKNITDDLN
jgi:hypothetical protein